ncbi:MAG: serine hydrolase [Proteobacteria bacterium]|nr:serine hydrolase [Pseudomonadota bacterium]
MIYLLLAVFLLLPQSLTANNEITAASYLLVEKDTFQVISGMDYHAKMAPASTTKVMTAIMAIEKLSGEEMVVPDSNMHTIPASKLNLVPDRKYRAMDLVKGALVKSANDAAYALAVHIGGTESNFARMMTEKAEEIGAHNTQFRNASGLFADGQYTTCYDLALIFRYALSNETFKETSATKYFFFNKGSQNIKYKNHNRLLFCFEPTIAGKTGFTKLSRHCYVGAFEKDGKVYILSMLGSNNLWGDVILILKNLFNELPSDKEIKLAKASPILLASYRENGGNKQIKLTAKKKTAAKSPVTLTSYKSQKDTKPTAKRKLKNHKNQKKHKNTAKKV